MISRIHSAKVDTVNTDRSESLNYELIDPEGEVKHFGVWLENLGEGNVSMRLCSEIEELGKTFGQKDMGCYLEGCSRPSSPE